MPDNLTAYLAAFEARIKLVGTPSAVLITGLLYNTHSGKRFDEMKATVDRGFNNVAERIDKLAEQYAEADKRVAILEEWRSSRRLGGG